MQFLDLLRSRAGQRKTDANEVLAAAANRAAANETVDHAAVEAALAEAGLSVDDFAEMVSLAKSRRQWRAQLAKGPAAEKQLVKAGETAERERAQFEKIRAAWFARAQEIDQEIDAARRVATTARDAREQLVRAENLCEPWRSRVADAVQALQEAEIRVGAIHRQMRETRERLDGHRHWEKHHRHLNSVGPLGTADDYARYVKRAERQLAELAAEHVEAVAARDAALKENAAAEESAVRS